MENIKNTNDLYESMNINNSTLSHEEKTTLKENGFVIFPPNEFMNKNLNELNKISEDLITAEGDKGGWEGKEKYYKEGKKFEQGAERLGNLIEKHELFRELILQKEILASAREVIKDDIKIVAVHLRNPLKDCGYQRLHIDGYPRYAENEPYSGIICMIYLDDSKISNGALRVVPKSHKKLGWPNEHVDIYKLHKDELNIEVKAGSILVGNLNLWHGGGNNSSGNRRKMIMINIKNRKEPQLLNYKKFLKKKTITKLNAYQKYLLAVRDIDPYQENDSAGGVNFLYRQKYGNKPHKKVEAN
jgi:hypothetical protein